MEETKMLRFMTNQEKGSYKTVLPDLNTEKEMVTGEVSNVYNCLAFTLGIEDKHVWPWPWYHDPTLEDFNELYKSYGYKKTEQFDGEIFVWGLSENLMTHGAKKMKDNLKCESKLGGGLRIIHYPTEISGDDYGRIIASYSLEKGNEQKLKDKIKSTIEKYNQEDRKSTEDLKTMISNSIKPIKLSQIETILEQVTKEFGAFPTNDSGRLKFLELVLNIMLEGKK